MTTRAHDNVIAINSDSSLASRSERSGSDNQVVPFSLDNDEYHDEKQKNKNKPEKWKRRILSTPLNVEIKQTNNSEHFSDKTSDKSYNDDSDEYNSENVKTYSVRMTSERPESLNEEKSHHDEDKHRFTAIIAQPIIPACITANIDLSRLSKLAVFPGTETSFIQGHILRVKTILSSQYNFFLNDQLVLMAEKTIKKRTSNYRIFDMTRSVALSSKFSKKSGNYIGKLRSNFSRKKVVLIGNDRRKTELGAIVFNNPFQSSKPREVTVILPRLSHQQKIEGLIKGDTLSTFSKLIDIYEHMADNNLNMAESLQVFQSKPPFFETGFYRLNFNGRVSRPSVKNFQLVKGSFILEKVSNAERPIFLQFGKVNDTKFHLDFRAPITPIQAFAAALAQFNL